MNFLFAWLLLCLFTPGCQQGSDPAKEQHPNNVKKGSLGICEDRARGELNGEYIYRHQTPTFTPPPPLPIARTPWSWERRFATKFPEITKEFFRCRGNPTNPMIALGEEGKENKIPLMIRDCRGSDRHSLPLYEGREFIYPCLIELLNYLQQKTQKRVVITTGHRCPDHALYADPSSQGRPSKHLIGAEVDFYIEGMQGCPEAVVALIQTYYREHPPYSGDPSYELFKRNTSAKLTTAPWYNKEIGIRLYLPHEGRDGDNQHPYPYLALEVRYDREKGERVQFDDKRARQYLRN